MAPNSTLDWTLVQAFLAVAETGSLSAAGRVLGLTQPTVGRQVRALEDRLGTELFRRHPQGMEPSAAGLALLPHAGAMREAASRFSLTAAGAESRLEGTVRITASRIVASHHLPGIVARIRRAEPGIQIEVVASDESQNLLFREADIAVRMYRPTQPDLIARHLGDVEIGLYGATSIDCDAQEGDIEAWLRSCDLVGYDAMTLLIDGLRAHGMQFRREDFPVRTDDPSVYVQLVAAGAGLGFLQVTVGDALPGVRRLDRGGLPTLPVWLTAAEALRRTPRIRRVWDLLAEELAGIVTRSRAVS